MDGVRLGPSLYRQNRFEKKANPGVDTMEKGSTAFTGCSIAPIRVKTGGAKKGRGRHLCSAGDQVSRQFCLSARRSL